MGLLLSKIRTLPLFFISTSVFFSCSYRDNDHRMNLKGFYTTSKTNSNVQITEEGMKFFESQIMFTCNSATRNPALKHSEIELDNKKIIKNFYIATLALHSKKNKVLLDFLETSTIIDYLKLFIDVIYYAVKKENRHIITCSINRNERNSFFDSVYEKIFLEFLKDRAILNETPKFGSPQTKIKQKSLKIFTKKYTQSDKKDSITKKFETPQKNSKLNVWGYKTKDKNLSIMNSKFLQRSDSKTDRNRRPIFSNKSITALDKVNSSSRKSKMNNDSEDEIHFMHKKSSSEKKDLRDSTKSINKTLNIDVSNYIKGDRTSRKKIFEEIEKKRNVTSNTDFQELLNFDSKKSLIFLFKRKK